MKKKILTGLMILAGAAFVFQGLSFAEEGGIAGKTEGIISETQAAADTAVVAVDEKKDDVKKDAEETVAVALQGDAVPVPVVDTKK